MSTILSENALLAALIRGGSYVSAQISARVSAADFSYTEQEIAFRAWSKLLLSGVAPTPAALRESLTDAVKSDPRNVAILASYSGAGQFAEVFVAARFAEPMESVKNVDFHAERIASLALLRRTRDVLAEACRQTDLNLAGEAPELNAAEVLAKLQTEVLKLSPVSPERTSVPELLPGFMEELWVEYETAPGTLRGLDTGFPSLNEMTRGFQNGHFIVLAAGSGVGKSVLAENLLVNAARSHFNRTGKPLGAQVFSFEMSKKELLERALFSEARVSINRFHKRILTGDDKKEISDAAARLRRILENVDFHDNASLSPDQMRSVCRQKRFHGRCDFVIVDYVQIVPGEKSGTFQNRELEVATIAKSLTAMAGELKIPVLALSQLNDDGKLRESRVLEKNAHLILYLEAVDEKDVVVSDDNTGKPHRLVIKKGRHSERGGRVWLSFFGGQTRFVEEQMGAF